MSKIVLVYTTQMVAEYRCHTFEMPDDFDESTLPESGAAGIVFEDDILPVLQEADRFGPTLMDTETQSAETADTETVRSWSVEASGERHL